MRQLVPSLPVPPGFLMDACYSSRFLDRLALDAANVVQPFGKCGWLGKRNVSQEMNDSRIILRRRCGLAFFLIEDGELVDVDDPRRFFLRESVQCTLALDVLAYGSRLNG